MEARLEPVQEPLSRLTTILGVSHLVAQTLVAEIGVDMTRFPTAGHLLSWAGLCPRMDESAGKRHSTRVRPGAPWLKTVYLDRRDGSGTSAGVWTGERLRISPALWKGRPD